MLQHIHTTQDNSDTASPCQATCRHPVPRPPPKGAPEDPRCPPRCPPHLPAFQVARGVHSPQWDQGTPTEGGIRVGKGLASSQGPQAGAQKRSSGEGLGWGAGGGHWSLTGCPGSPSSPRSPFAPSWPCREEAGSGGPDWRDHLTAADPPPLPAARPHPKPLQLATETFVRPARTGQDSREGRLLREGQGRRGSRQGPTQREDKAGSTLAPRATADPAGAATPLQTAPLPAPASTPPRLPGLTRGRLACSLALWGLTLDATTSQGTLFPEPPPR